MLALLSTYILRQKTASGICQSPPFVIFRAVLLLQPLLTGGKEDEKQKLLTRDLISTIY